MKNIVLCPIHGVELKITPRIIPVLGIYYNTIEGKCPQCRAVYIDQKIKGIARFTYEGTNYQYSQELESWRITEEKRSEAERKETERKIALEKEKKRLERKRLEQERKRLEELRRKEKELRASMPKMIYVIRSIDAKICPVCSKRTSMAPRSLTLQSGKDGLKSITIMGYSCTRCRSVFISEKTAENEFLEQYIDYLNLDYLNTKEREETLKRKKLEEKFPFMTSQSLEIRIGKYIQNRCPIHKKTLKELGWIVSRSKSEPEKLLYGCYCQDCNAVYLKFSEQEKIQNFLELYGKSAIPIKMLPAELQHTHIKPVKVASIKMWGTKQEMHSIDINRVTTIPVKQKHEIPAERGSNREIAIVIAQIDEEERTIHILTSVKEIDRQCCTIDEILVREAESIGRELLGRIAHNQLGKFMSKIGVIKIRNYKVWPGQEYHLEGFTKFSNPDNIQDITIMGQKNLIQNSEDYEMVTALVYCANRQEPIYIDVYYSKEHNKYFINEESYRQYRIRYGLPYVHLISGVYGENVDYGKLRQYSELNLYGYTVAKSANMTTGERQQLLGQLIDGGLMSKHQIVNHLEWLIHRQSGRIMMENARDCWKEDLRFVNNYHLNSQRMIRGRFVYGKNAL